MAKKPLVSILIASYNKSKFVKRCIKSCLSQTYQNIEIIFVDDNSTDNSFEIAKQFKKVKVYKKKNLIKNRNFNTFFQIDTYLYAFKKSKGKYIFFLDSDDFFDRKKIFKIVKNFQNNKNDQIIFDKPVIYFSKKKYHLSKNFNLTGKQKLWPKFPPQSCISVKRDFFKKLLLEIKKKRFDLLTLDFRLAVLSSLIYNNFKILNHYLTYYYQDEKGESYIKFRKFGENWWLRRNQAYEYIKYLEKKYDRNFSYKLDYLITKLITIIIKLIKNI